MLRFRCLVGLMLCALSIQVSAYEGQLQPEDRILVTSHSPDALMTVNREGVIEWTSKLKLPHPQQVSALEDGRVFCATINGAVLLNKDASVQWTYQVPQGAENATALFIAPDRYLVSHEGKNELVELNGQGNLILTTPLAPLNVKTHGQIRYTGFGDGNYLVPRLNASTFQEIEVKTGKVIWEVKKMQTVTSAIRRSDGGTFICNNNTLNSYNKDRNLEWKIDFKADFGLSKAVPPVAILQLPKGNLIVALYHGHEDVPDLMEIDPSKKSLVQTWSLKGIKNAAGVAHLPVGHLFLAP